MSVPTDLARMSPQQLQELRARAAVDQKASPAARERLGEHIVREVRQRAAKN